MTQILSKVLELKLKYGAIEQDY